MLTSIARPQLARWGRVPIERSSCSGYTATVSRSRLPALLIASLPAFAADTAAAAGPGSNTKASSEGAVDQQGRFPIWPTEIDRVAAPLRDPAMMSESARIAALEELAEYATVVILPDLEFALSDPSPEVRRLALELCVTRQVLACVDEAEQMWIDGEGSVRLMALELLSQIRPRPTSTSSTRRCATPTI